MNDTGECPFAKGAVLFRLVLFSSNGPVLSPLHVDAQGGSYVCRVSPPDCGPILRSYDDRGMICFAKEEPGPLATHAVVTRISKNGKSLNIRFVNGDLQKHLELFLSSAERAKIAKAQLKTSLPPLTLKQVSDAFGKMYHTKAKAVYEAEMQYYKTKEKTLVIEDDCEFFITTDTSPLEDYITIGRLKITAQFGDPK